MAFGSRAPLRVQGGPFAERPEEMDYMGGPRPSTMTAFGADAAIARKQRELALAGLDTALEDARFAAEPAALRQQRAYIASHGTIETPQDFERRMGMQTAADAADPANPIGKLRGQEHARKLEGIEMSNVRPAEVAGQTQRDVAGIESGDRRYVAGQEAGAREWVAETEAEQRERAAWLDNLFGSILPGALMSATGSGADERRAAALKRLQGEIDRLGLDWRDAARADVTVP